MKEEIKPSTLLSASFFSNGVRAARVCSFHALAASWAGALLVALCPLQKVRRELFSGHSRGEGAQTAELAGFGFGGAMRD